MLKTNNFFYTTQTNQLPSIVDNPDNKTLLLKISKEAAKCLGLMPFIMSVNGQSLLWNMGDKILKKTTICPSALLPPRTNKFIENYFINYLRLVPYLVEDNYFSWCIAVPIAEELIFRVALQEYLLKRIPEKFIHKINPTHANSINYTAMKIARISLSALFFGLCHTHNYTCKNGDLYPHIMAGLILGALQEISTHPVYNIIAHIAHNTLGIYKR